MYDHIILQQFVLVCPVMSLVISDHNLRNVYVAKTSLILLFMRLLHVIASKD